MADLSKELNEYLLSGKNEKQYKITIPSVSISKANFGKWFGKNTDETEENAGWIQRAQRNCCPAVVVHFLITLTNRQIIVLMLININIRISPRNI